MFVTTLVLLLQRKMLEARLADDQVKVEFNAVPGRTGRAAECACATLEENTLRSRFKDVLPYDVTRVELASSKQNPHGYINASHVKVTVAVKG